MAEPSDNVVFADVLKTASKLMAVEAARLRYEAIILGKIESDPASIYYLNAAVRCQVLAERYENKK